MMLQTDRCGSLVQTGEPQSEGGEDEWKPRRFLNTSVSHYENRRGGGMTYELWKLRKGLFLFLFLACRSGLYLESEAIRLEG